jgi:polygalacturonase
LRNVLRRAVGSRRVWLAALGMAGLVVATTTVASAEAAPGGVSAAAVFNVRDYGATGNGSSNDTPAINKAIAAANAAGGGTVEVPSGRYLAGGSIHMMSNVTMQLDSGSTILGNGSGYDAPESNQFDQYQDYGHSHFHDAMIWGDRLTNIGFVGSGTIDGNNKLITGNPSSGQADKIISLTRCDGLTLNGITLRQGGHFAILINGCNHVTSDHLNIQTASDRDGWNIISTQNVTITNITDAANDDALVFKSDYALGQKLPNGHVTVTNAQLSAGCCNALMFGSETCGDFTDYNFDTINITGANKSGLGMVSMDGSNITDVHYRNITVSNVASPIMQKIGTRRRCGNSPGVGHISNITYDNIRITGKSSPQYSATTWGEAGSNQISNITYNNVHITVPGGHGSMSTGVPSNNATDYNPNSIGTRPSYGWYIHNANNITFNNSGVDFGSGDARPAVIANTGSALLFDHFTAERSTGSADMIFQSINGYCVRDSTNTDGGALRITATGSTQSCPAQGNDFSLAVTPTSQTVAPGGTATYTVNTSTVSGSPGNITLSATGLPAGATAAFSPNPVPAGSSATLSIATDTSTPNGTSAITVTGTAGSATHTASTSLTVGTGTPTLSITGLSVADSANAADWSVQSNLHTGSVQYGDRAFTLTTVPSGLVGVQWVRTANDSKTSTANPLVRFTVNRSVTVSVAVDNRIGRRSWMDSGWVDSGTSLKNNESTPRTFEVFTKTFPAGQISLGPNDNSGSSMYMIVVT